MSYRYGSEEMRAIWSERQRQLVARDIWIAVAETQMQSGIVSPEEYNDLLAHRDEIDIDTILAREMNRADPRFTGHETVAAISHYQDVAPLGGKRLHQGMTSDDILSNVETIQIKDSLAVIEAKITKTLKAFAGQIDRNRDKVCVGWTHLQPAEPTTVGYRLARYAQDLLKDLALARFVMGEIKGKGIKGAVGSSASFEQLLDGTDMDPRQHEATVMKSLGLEAATVTGQTYPRKFTLWTLLTLCSIGQTCHQFASDLKILQSAAFGEWVQPKSGVGSSAMPHKENPATAETIKSLARSLPGKAVESWLTAAEVTLERGLEDSAGKRSYLPESFLIVDEILGRTEWLVRGLEVRDASIQRNLEQFGPFMALEMVLSEVSKRGGNRQEAHQILAEYATEAWRSVQRGETNPLPDKVAADDTVTRFIPSQEVRTLFSAIRGHIGDAPQRCEEFLSNELGPAIDSVR
jgi:adenylosuccinate lyase